MNILEKILRPPQNPNVFGWLLVGPEEQMYDIRASESHNLIVVFDTNYRAQLWAQLWAQAVGLSGYVPQSLTWPGLRNLAADAKGTSADGVALNPPSEPSLPFNSVMFGDLETWFRG